MRRTFVGVILVLGLCTAVWLAAGGAIEAQQPSPSPEWYSVSVVNVKPDMLDDWLELQRSETIPALQKIGVRERAAWQSAIFSEGFEYVFVQPIAKMADLDQPGPFVRALGPEGARAYNAKVRRMVNATRTLAIQVLRDASIAPAAGFTPKLAVVTFSYVAPGRTADYENYLKTDLLPALRKAQPVGYVHSRTIFGGDAGEYVSLRYIDTFAEIDKGPLLTQALGAAAAAKINAKVAGMVTRQERRIIRFNPDLSFRTKTSS
jgi:hypothetical protein